MKGYRYQCTCCKFIQVVHLRKGMRPKQTIKGFCSKSKSNLRVNYTLVEGK